MSLQSIQSTSVAPVIAALVFFAVGCDNSIQDLEPVAAQTKAAVEVLPADARFVGMVNFTEVQSNEMTSPFGAGMFSLDALEGEAEARVRNFLDATGFEPQKDLERVYVAVAETDGGELPVIVAYASYDLDRVTAFLRDNTDDSLTESMYRDITVFEGADANDNIFIALANESMIVASPSRSDLEEALDRLLDSGRALDDNAKAMDMVRKVASGSIWVVAQDINEGAHGSHGSNSVTDDFAGAISDIAFSLRVNENGIEGTSYITPAEGVSADDLSSLTKASINVLKAGAKDDAVALRTLDEVRVATSGGNVRIEFAADNTALAKFTRDAQ